MAMPVTSAYPLKPFGVTRNIKKTLEQRNRLRYVRNVIILIVVVVVSTFMGACSAPSKADVC